LKDSRGGIDKEIKRSRFDQGEKETHLYAKRGAGGCRRDVTVGWKNYNSPLTQG